MNFFQKTRYLLLFKLLKHLTPNLFFNIRRSNNTYSVFDGLGAKFYMRPSIKFIKNRNIKNLIGVEIGVKEGNNALYMLKQLDIKKLYLIDPYTVYTSLNKVYNNTTLYNLVQKLFSKDKRIEIIRGYSFNACTLFNDNSLDFVYIDGNHEYDYVYDDIKSWYKKLKINGILSGHDIALKEVFKGLNDYCSENKIEYFIDPPDWYIIKEKEQKDKKG